MYDAKPLTLKQLSLFERWVNFKGARHQLEIKCNETGPQSHNSTPIHGEDVFWNNDQEILRLLGAGIVHDFNNLLTVIMVNLELARLCPDSAEQSQVWHSFEQVERAVQQAKALNGYLSTLFQGTAAMVKQDISLEELLKTASQLGLAGTYKVDCNLRLQPELPMLNVDKIQLSQVIMNLVLNAVQAMPAGGCLDIEAQQMELAEGQVESLAGGRYIMVSFRDNGVGIPAEYLSKIFAPRFTTKAQGKGLGLALSYAIIKRHKGHLTVESRPGVGTTFRLFLPIN